MTPKNGNLWKIIGLVLKIIAIVTGVIIVTSGIIYGYATLEHQVSDNAKMQPKVDAHEKYIEGDKIDTAYIKRDIAEIKDKVDNIDSIQRQILEEVRK